MVTVTDLLAKFLNKIEVKDIFCNKLFNGLLAFGINAVINLKNSIIFDFVVFSGCNEFGQCRT